MDKGDTGLMDDTANDVEKEKEEEQECLSDVETSVDGGSDRMDIGLQSLIHTANAVSSVDAHEAGQYRRVSFEECQREEEAMLGVSGQVSTSVENAYRDRDTLVAGIVSRLDGLAARTEDAESTLSVSRNFIQYSNEFLHSSGGKKAHSSVMNVIARFGTCIAVGASDGSVAVVYESSVETPVAPRGDEVHNARGVTAMHICPYGNSMLLVVGYASGLIRIWENRGLVGHQKSGWSHGKDIVGCHAARITALCVVHVGSVSWIVSSDSHGRLMTHNVQRYLSITAQALAGISRQLTGQATGPSFLNTLKADSIQDVGNVVGIEGLPMDLCGDHCPHVLVSTTKGVLVARVHSTGRVAVMRIVAQSDDDGPWCAAWKHMGSTDSHTDVCIAAAQGSSVALYSCRMETGLKKGMTTVKVTKQKSLQCEATIQGVAFLSELAVLGIVHHEQETEKTCVQLLLPEQYLGGDDDDVICKNIPNIERNCFQDWIIPQPSEDLLDGQLVWSGSVLGGPDIMLLTSHGVRVVQLLTWQQKVGALVAKNLPEDALSHTVILFHRLEIRSELVQRGTWPSNVAFPREGATLKKQLLALMVMYIQQALSQVLSDRTDSNVYRMRQAIVLSIDVCLLADRLDFLYDEIVPLLRDQGHVSETPKIEPSPWHCFLENLESAILDRRVSSDLPPQIIQSLVEYFVARLEIQRIERVILRFDVGSLDLNQLIPLCIKHQLFSVVLYIFSRAMKDYKSPAALLFAAAVDEHKSGRGNGLTQKLLVYIDTCLSGNKYPPGTGKSDFEQEQEMRLQMMDFVLYSTKDQIQEVVRLWESVASLAVTKSGEDIYNVYPHRPVLSFLCEMDAKRILGMLQRLLSSWDALEKDIWEQQGSDAHTSGAQSSPHELQTLTQAAVNRVVDLLDEDDLSTSVDQMPVGTESKLQFIAHHVSSNRASIPKDIIYSVLKYVSSLHFTDETAFDACQKIFTEVVSNSKDVSDDRLLELARKARFSSSEAQIMYMKGQYMAAMECILRDERENRRALKFYRDILSDNSISKQKRDTFRDASLKLYPELVKIDPDISAEIALEFSGNNQKEILEALNSDSNLQFNFLQSVISILKDQIPSSASGIDMQKPLDPEYAAWFNLINDQSTASLYLRLMCRFEPENVMEYLRTTDSYDIDDCLEYCAEYNLHQASAFLLERKGDFKGAFEIFMKEIENSNNRLFECTPENAETFAQKVETVCKRAVDLCARSSQDHVDPSGTASAPKDFWIHLLSAYIEPFHRGTITGTSKIVLLGCIEKTLDGASMYTDVQPIIVDAIHKYEDSPVNAIRDVIMTLLKCLKFYHAATDISSRVSTQDSVQAMWDAYHKLAGKV
ncbi:hypothetical protein M9434_001855 [Picochlorum sp. BPE23]|nr:hypothetical protein M9434_001855 [Picochlorum sp. BPE23]